MDRREALKKMAVGGASVVGASVVLSNVAFADSGTTKCRHPYATPAFFTAVLTRPFFVFGNAVVTVGGIPVAACPCGGAPPTITYAFSVVLDAGSTATSNTLWQASNTFNSGSDFVGFNGTMSYTVSVGIKLDCAGVSGRAVICRFGTIVGSASSFPTSIGPISLTSPPPAPAGLPSC